MTLAGLKKVDSGRTTGIGRWVQELGTCGFTILESIFFHMLSSLERFLCECVSKLSSSIDGAAIPGEVCGRKVGGQRRTSCCMEARKDWNPYRRRGHAANERDG